MSSQQYDQPDFEEQNESLFPEVHLWDYVQIVVQRLPLAILVFSIVVGLALIYSLTRADRYTASARLLVDPSSINVTDFKNAIDPSMSTIGKREFMQTQAMLVTSRPVLEKVIADLNLLASPDVESAKNPVKRLSELITVTPVRNTHLITVSAEREDAAQASAIVNSVVGAYLAANRARRLGVSDEGLEQLNEKSDLLRDRLEAATSELQQFMTANDMVSYEKTQSVVMDRLRSLNTTLSNLQPRRMGVESWVTSAQASIAAGNSITSLPNINDAPVIKELKLDLANLQHEYSQLLHRLGEKHPQLLAISTQLDSVQVRMAMEAQEIMVSQQGLLTQLTAEEALLNEAIDAQEKVVRDFNILADQMAVLKQNRDSIEGPYNRIITRVEEISINKIGAQGENIFIDTPAVKPVTKSWPSHGKNLLIAIILGGGLAVGLCFFLDYMDTTIKSDNDVRRYLGSAVIGGIPGVTSKKELKGGQVDTIANHNPTSHAAEAFRSLRTSLTFARPNKRIEVLVVSSTMPAEGKSMTAINLAITNAASSRRTLLIDADMRKPRLHNVFSTSSEHGLSSYLTEKKVTLPEVVSPTEIESLDFMKCGPLPRNPAELLDSSRFTEMLTEARQAYDMVVIDSPPGFALVDPLIIARQADGLLLVVRSFVTPKEIAGQLSQRLRDAGADLLGICLNNVDVPRGGHGYGNYRYQYGKYYKKYYSHDA